MAAALESAAVLTLLGPLERIPESPAPGAFLAIMIGFALGIYAHAARLRWLVAIAIAIVFAGSIALLLAASGLEDRPLPLGGG